MALVIGNSRYEHSPLRNPVNDAQTVAETLRQMDFDQVRLLQDVGLSAFERAVDEFSDLVRAQGGLAFVFFAGHGIEIGGENYLLPIDFRARRPREARYSALRLNRLLARLERRSGPNVVVLDACRNNPFGTSRGLTAGLSSTDAPPGTFIAFATAPGKTAADGDGALGTFTASLVKYMPTPDMDIRDVMMSTRRQVALATRNEQVPWESSSLLGRVSLRPKGGDRDQGRFARKQAVRVIGPRTAGGAFVGATPIGTLPASVDLWPGAYVLDWIADSARSDVHIVSPFIVKRAPSTQIIRLRRSSSSSKTPTTRKNVNGPAWLSPDGFPKRDNVFSAVAASPRGSNDLAFSRMTACFRSTAALQRKFEAYTSQLMADYTGVKPAKKPPVISESENVEEISAAGFLEGFKCPQSWRDPNSGTVYALAELDLNRALNKEKGQKQRVSAVGVADVIGLPKSDYLASAELNAIAKALAYAASYTRVHSSSIIRSYNQAGNVGTANVSVMTDFTTRLGLPTSRFIVQGTLKDYARRLKAGEQSEILFDQRIRFGQRRVEDLEIAEPDSLKNGRVTLRFEQGLWTGQPEALRPTLARVHDELSKAGIAVISIDEMPDLNGAPQVEVGIEWRQASPTELAEKWIQRRTQQIIKALQKKVREESPSKDAK